MRKPQTIRLRPWQKAALDLLTKWEKEDFLAVATPGAGKTTFALAAVCNLLKDRRARVLVVAPTAHLKRQWALAASRFGLHLDSTWVPSAGPPPPDMHGIVTTYQQVASSADLLARVSKEAVIVLDEIHHAGDDRAWGSALKTAFSCAAFRLAMSGTPFRSDSTPIPFISYMNDQARPDFEYGYGEALADGKVVRPVYFPRAGGQFEWSAPDGSIHAASFDDPLNTLRANQRLRAALSLDGDWLPEVLRNAHLRLEEIRRSHPEAGGLIIASDVEHARGIAEQMSWRFGVRATVATSDDATASDRIASFANGNAPWLVAVRMVSEGVDIPRLRVGVYATTTTTELFFRQAVGRLVRWLPNLSKQDAWLYIPDDSRLRSWAYQVTQVRRHNIRREDPEKEQDVESVEFDRLSGPRDDADQPSLFAMISAVATEVSSAQSVIESMPAQSLAYFSDDEDPELLLHLAAPPLPSGVVVAEGELSRQDTKKQLREQNTDIARELSRRTGMTHAQVNAELNRLSGLRSITQATVKELQTRLDHAKRWRARL